MQTAPDLYDALLASWLRHLRAANRAPLTLVTYRTGVRQLRAYLTAQGLPLAPEAIGREHVEAYLAAVLSHQKPATAANRYRALNAWFKWLVEEGELSRSPMAQVRAPAIPETPPAVLTEDQCRALLKVTAGPTFEARRDHAMIVLLIDTGMRRGELLGLRVADVELRDGLCTVVGKGDRLRYCPMGAKATAAVDRYLRARTRHPKASLPALWLSSKGAYTRGGLLSMLRKRAAQAGLTHLHTHQFRHTAAHLWLANDGQEQDLMQLMGWRSRTMVGRYAASAASARAIKAHRRRGIADRL